MKIILYVKNSREFFTQKTLQSKKTHIIFIQTFLIITSIKPLTKPN